MSKGKGSEMPRRQVTSLSLEERTSSEPFQNRKQLYLMHFFFAFVSRMWDMGIVLLVAQLTNNSLFLVAVTGLLSALAVFLFMTTVGAWLDKTNRITAVRVALRYTHTTPILHTYTYYTHTHTTHIHILHTYIHYTHTHILHTYIRTTYTYTHT
jgi:hypothetical protein